MSLIREFRFREKVEIEGIASEILRQMCQTRGYLPEFPLDASRVAEFLGLDVVWDQIAPDDEGAIAARIIPIHRLIEINENLAQLGLGLAESTIAHEIGHWMLHIDQTEIGRDLTIARHSEQIICRTGEHLKGREWQAQYFATCLLMPREQLEKVIRGKNLQKWSHLYGIAADLGVTISNLVHRLKDLGWIELIPDSRQILPLKLPLPRIREDIKVGHYSQGKSAIIS